MSRQTTSIYTNLPPVPSLGFHVIRQLTTDEIEAAIEMTPSAKRFRKLADAHSTLVFAIQGALVHVDATYYANKADGHNKGDLNEPAFAMQVFTLSLTDMERFFAQVTFEERFPKFRDGTPKPAEFAFYTGRAGRTGRKPAPMFTQITPLLKEINECL